MKQSIKLDPTKVAHLKAKSSEMKALIDLIGPLEVSIVDDPFIALITQVIYQFISFKAANKIVERFYDNFKEITPDSILSCSYDEIKNVGLSHSKTKYIFHIAKAFKQDEIDLNFHSMNDDQVKRELQKIKGIGTWTSDMFLIFHLNRDNVLCYSDVAIRKGIEWLYDLDHSLSKEEFKYYQDLFAPYGTIASHYLWEITIRSYWAKKDHIV